MNYFKHAELANQYHVSLKTVYNWIDAAKQGKLDLELVDQNGKTYIADKQSNVMVLRQLAQEGKKYRNARYHKVITPKPELYKLFTRKQILDIITSLKTQGEIPRQYSYFDKGAMRWDELMEHYVQEPGVGNLLKGSQELLHGSLEAIDRLTEGYSRVNVVDVGPGNALPVKELLEHLIDKGALHRYIAIDLSQEMLRIAERNVKEWFGDKIRFEGYVRDITHERFNDVLVDDMLDEEAEQTINLMLLLGGTPTNFPVFSDPVRVIQGSMGADDLLVYTGKPDTEASRRYFAFGPNSGPVAVPPINRFVLEPLNITEDLYDVEMDFDDRQRMRYIRIRLTTAITLRFQFESGTHDVNLEKGSTVLLLRMWHKSALEIIGEFQQAGLMLLQSSMTKDRSYLLAVFGVEETETTV